MLLTHSGVGAVTELNMGMRVDVFGIHHIESQSTGVDDLQMAVVKPTCRGTTLVVHPVLHPPVTCEIKYHESGLLYSERKTSLA